jgi:hypothetical protein
MSRYSVGLHGAKKMNSKLLTKVYSWPLQSHCVNGERYANGILSFSGVTTLTLTAVVSILLIGSATVALGATYKTQSNQVVVTGLKPRTQYTVQTTNFSARKANRTITTNGCGEALISNGTGYRRLIINQQTITPSSLSTQTHQRCNSRRNSRVIHTQPQM